MFQARAVHLDDRIASLQERLPAVPPHDLVLAATPELWREIADNSPDLLDKARPPLALPEDVQIYARRIAQALTTIALPDEPAPRYTPDRHDDYLVHLASRCDGVIVSGDKRHVVPRSGCNQYSTPSGTVCAYRLRDFIGAEVDNSNFELRDVDGTLLSQIVASL